MPLFESESKKLQIQVKSSNKTATAPTIEGTSVMPRQRPKASTSTPLTLTNIPLTLSPSPTAKKSQSPIISNTTDNQFQSFNQNPTKPFQTNNQIFSTTTTTPNFSPAFQHTQFFASSQESNEKNLENLFQSSIYPDPFRDDGNTSPTTLKNDTVTSPVSPNQSFNSSTHGLCPSKQGLVESTSQSTMGTIITPPASPSLATQKGHRRNMSDTSAFNKYKP